MHVLKLHTATDTTSTPDVAPAVQTVGDETGHSIAVDVGLEFAPSKNFSA